MFLTTFSYLIVISKIWFSLLCSNVAYEGQDYTVLKTASRLHDSKNRVRENVVVVPWHHSGQLFPQRGPSGTSLPLVSSAPSPAPPYPHCPLEGGRNNNYISIMHFAAALQSNSHCSYENQIVFSKSSYSSLFPLFPSCNLHYITNICRFYFQYIQRLSAAVPCWFHYYSRRADMQVNVPMAFFRVSNVISSAGVLCREQLQQKDVVKQVSSHWCIFSSLGQ